MIVDIHIKYSQKTKIRKLYIVIAEVLKINSPRVGDQQVNFTILTTAVGKRGGEVCGITSEYIPPDFQKPEAENLK